MAVEIISELRQKNGLEFPIVDTNNIKGGFYQVDTIAERDAIPDIRKRDGMLCFVKNDPDEIYTYLWSDGNWVKSKIGSAVDANNTKIAGMNARLDVQDESISQALGAIEKNTSDIKNVSDTVDTQAARLDDVDTTLENALFKNKGYFTTLEKLNEAVPNPTIGSKAYVGTSEPYVIYIVENGVWVDSGYTGGNEIVANITTERIEDGAVTIGKLEPSIQSLVTNISKNATFAGIATPTTNPGIPDGPVFYIATETGTYSNFGGISVADWEAVILQWNNGTWTKKTTGFAIQQEVDDRLTELGKTKVSSNNNSETKVSDNSDGFYFTDKSGNVIAKILSDGVHAVALYDKDGNKIGSADASIESIKDKAKQDGFYFTDAVGNVIVKITKDGLQAIKFLNKDNNEIGASGDNKSHPLYGKDIYSFGDSLCKGAWEKMLADITGANFNKEANDLTSWGGSFTGDEGGPLYNEEGYGQNGDRPGGLRRAKNFVLMPKETYGNKDVIFFENVHDGVLESENISAKPFMWTRYAIYEGQEFYDTNVAGRYFEENRSSVLQSVGFTTPQVGTMVKMKVKAVTVPLIFSNGATNSGSVKISINGNDFETEVTEGDSIEQVIDKISVWSFSDTTGWKNKKLNSTTINLQYVGGNNSSEDDVITFDGQGTGVVATINNKTETVAYRTHAFLSLDINEWNNSEAWSYYAHHTRCYSNWKGVIEYIQKNCPETKMYMLLFPNSVYNKSYVRANGSFDVEAFYASTPWQQHINNRRCLINVADYYNIPIIDLEKEMNVMCNWETYFPENNVHMKNTLHQRFAEIIASKIY